MRRSPWQQIRSWWRKQQTRRRLRTLTRAWQDDYPWASISEEMW
jgi:uncharacterized protein YjiS (DUF1127 family)